jgi:hypothetical protein
MAGRTWLSIPEVLSNRRLARAEIACNVESKIVESFFQVGFQSGNRHWADATRRAEGQA